MSSQDVRCPHCGNGYPDSTFTCPLCESIINPNPFAMAPTLPEGAVPHLVRRMLAPPDESLEQRIDRSDKTPLAFDEVSAETVPLVPVPYEDIRAAVPSLLVGIDISSRPLTVFEAFAASLVDGGTNVDEIRGILGMAEIEMRVILGTLIDKGVLELLHPEQQSAVPKAAAGPPSSQVARVVTKKVRPVELSKPREPLPVLEPGQAPPANQRGFYLIKAGGTAPDAGRERVESPLQRAVRYEKAGRLTDAVKVLEDAIAMSPAPAPLYNRLALVVIKESRDLIRAEELLNKAQRADPKNEVYRNNLYKVLFLVSTVKERAAAKKKKKKR